MIPGWGAKIPHASWPKTKTRNRSNIVTNSIKTSKMVTSKKKKNPSPKVVTQQMYAPSRICTTSRHLQSVQMHWTTFVVCPVSTYRHPCTVHTNVYTHTTVLVDLLHPIPVFCGVPNHWPLWIQPYLYNLTFPLAQLGQSLCVPGCRSLVSGLCHVKLQRY